MAPAVLAAPVPNSRTPTGSPIYRNTKSATLTDTPEAGLSTLYDLTQRTFKKFAPKQALGQRRLIRVVEEEKMVTKKLPSGEEVSELKKWKFFELSAFEFITWGQAQKLVHAYACGLRALGLQRGDKVTIYADTSRDWMLSAMACFEQSLTITTAYATLGQDGLKFSLNECEITTIVTMGELLPMITTVGEAVPTLKNVIYSGSVEETVLEELKRKHPHFKVISLDELQALGELNPTDPVPPSKEDLAVIMYTSGSTGTPKGVMLTHANVVAAVSGGVSYLLPYFTEGEDYYLAFLPLAHILEFALEFVVMFVGAPIGYGSVKTLTDASVRNCKGDIRELRPTFIAGVPQVYESIRKAVESKIRGAKPIIQSVFQSAFNLKWKLMQAGLEGLAGPLDKIVFNRIKDQVGGRLKFALSGGAPLPRSTQQFLNVTCTKLFNGYGMTECAAVLALQEITQITELGRTGAPCTNVEVKLVDVENTSYKSTNTPKPQGEIWVRGASVMKGYYKQPQQTKEAITEDGWLMTGDIAEMNADGTLQIIDRKKNLVKLANGEYIALEKLESNYKTSKFVQNICVHADSDQSYAIAIVQPIEKEIRDVSVSLGLYSEAEAANVDFGVLCARKEVKAAVLSSLKDVAKSTGLKQAEIVGQVHLATEEWTPQSGMLTAAMKLQRVLIVKKFRPDINAIYGV
ncbi:long-chain fatty acid-CoA ligase [Entophlyctis luteolus]|nr:long-chain fatty acid-CoA ligase [Entophlyctis luteolus]KAJ3381168.1 long-chain fatty acid-CoA ligase [Entophlyctis sp. JEL0112]